MNTLRFSVVIPTYNRAHSILPTLESVRRQSFTEFECLIVDDGSADRNDLLSLVSSLGDPRFRCVLRENGGGGAARNSGIAEAKGEYIAFLDSDDLFVPHKLALFDEILTGKPFEVYYSKVDVDRGVDKFWTRPDRAIRPNEEICDYLFVDNQFIQTSSIVIPGELAKRVRFDPTLRKGQDLDFCVRLFAAGARFVMIEESLSVWTDRSEENRTSRHAGHAAPLAWLRRTSHLLTARSIAGYRATVLAYYLASEHPFIAIKYLMGGLLAGVPLKVIGRQFLRCFVPRKPYRRLANFFVAIRGNPQP